jgi:hypothetical protein
LIIKKIKHEKIAPEGAVFLLTPAATWGILRLVPRGLRNSEPEGTKRTRNDDPSVEQINSARWGGAKGDRAYRKVSQTQVGSTGCFDPEGEIPEGSDSRIHLRMRRMDVEITGIGPLIRQTVIENGSLGGSGRTDFSR